MTSSNMALVLTHMPLSPLHRLIYDNILEGFGMFCYVKDTIYVALKVSVAFENMASVINALYSLFNTDFMLVESGHIDSSR